MDIRINSEAVITLRNGVQCGINEHVYFKDYVAHGKDSVARIMEFLPPEGKSGTLTAANDNNPSSNMKVQKGKGRERNPKNGNYTRVRLARYYRISDVYGNRVKIKNPRVLFAAIHSEIHDISQLRDKCYVIHRDKLASLEEWTRKPDRFYFYQLYDIYSREEFEILLSTDVRNVPSRIRDILVSRYEYIATEKEAVLCLTGSPRHCEECEEWCGHDASAQCAACRNHFHMPCLNPPLVAKPSHDYGWICATCSDRAGSTAERASGNFARIKPRGRPCKERSGLNEEGLQVKHYKLWPFRYFGLYTDVEDTLDPDDFIYPRAAPREGPKYQASLPPPRPGELVSPTLNAPVATTSGSTSSGTEDIERGGDSTIEVLSLVRDFSEDDKSRLESIMERSVIKEGQLCSVDWLTEIVRRATQAHFGGRDLESVSMQNSSRLEKWKEQETSYTDREWDNEEVTAFAEAVANSQAPDDLRAVAERVHTRSLPEIVRFYGKWVNEETMSNGSRASALVGSAGPAGTKIRSVEKRKGEPSAAPTTKRVKVVGPAATARNTPPAVVVPSEVRYKCVSCFTTGPRGKVLKCNECGVTLHAGACGAVLCQPNQVDTWLCELCENERTQKYSLNADCLLCPRPQKPAKDNEIVDSLNGKETKPSETYLRACKPTEGYRWVHLLCAVFIPELRFSDASKLNVVEGVSAIPEHRWRTKCSICNVPGGAVVQCGNCPKKYHVSCAWRSGHKFGLDIEPWYRQDATDAVNFKNRQGVMKAVVCCKDHSAYRRNTYDICDKDDAGETALQVYARTYKQAPTQTGHGLLRKALQLDRLLQIPRDASFPSEETATNENPICTTCKTEYSPFFHPSPTDPARWLCHRCYFSARAEETTPEIIMQDV